MSSRSTSKSNHLAIIGIGCIFPKAADLNQYWANIKNRVDAITEVPKTHWSVEEFYNNDPKAPDMTYARKGGFISPVDFDPLEFGITPNALEATDTSQLLGLVVAKRALEDAGYGSGKDFNRGKTSVVLGVTGTLELVIPLGARLGHPVWRKALKDAGADDKFTEDVVSRISESYVGWQELSFPGLLGNVVAGRIANNLDLHGTNCVVDAACGSSLSALNLAALELESGKSDMVLTGGVDTFNDIFMYMCFSKTPALSATGDARPFDINCDGTMIGEGLGMMALKRLEDAERDGDRIYAVIKGLGTSSDGKGAAVFAPKADGQKRALKNAYEISGVKPRTVELLEAHGTGTKVGDITEVTALTDVYTEESNDKQWCALGSVKSQIGHTKAAAGIAGMIKSALALYHKVFPPTIKVDKPMEVLAKGDTPFYVNTEKRPWMSKEEHPRRAAVSCFGFGGSNYHCILEENASQKNMIDWDDSVEIFAFSGDDISSIEKQIDSIGSSVKWESICNIAAQSRSSFNPDHKCRLAFVAERDNTDVAKLISNAKLMLEKNRDKKSWSTPDGIYFGSGRQTGSAGVIFPGQGSQYVGMQRDLVCQFPASFKCLEDADKSFAKNKAQGLNRDLSGYMYPVPVFDEENKKKNEAELRDTRVAQPALGAASLGTFRTLEYFGLKPDAFAGHSYGELVALCASGRISEGDLHYLSALRGNLMAGQKSDLGSMLAVQTQIDKIENVIKENSINLVIANKNAPGQAVLSGVTSEINRAAEIFTKLGVKNTKLQVAAAFHSPVISDAQIPFAKALEKVEFSKSTIPVYSNTTSEKYPDDPKAARAILAGQLAKPVEFVNEIRNMYKAGIRLFVEAGPGAKMSGLIKSILGEYNDIEVVATDSSNGKKNGTLDFAKALAQIASVGIKLNITLWNPADPNKTAKAGKSKMVIPVCGANYVKPAEKRKPVPTRTMTAMPEKTAANSTPAINNLPVSSTPSGGMNMAESNFQNKNNISNTPLSPASSQMPVNGGVLSEAIRITQRNMEALQNIQEQTAKLHQQFLESQDSAIRAFQSLVEQQQNLLYSSISGAPVQIAVAQPQPASVMQSACEPAKPIYQAPPVVTPRETIPAGMPQPPATVAPAVNTGDITNTILSLVSEKTGYPSEMLELDMSLDSDLGIDSIKRVEIFSALSEKFSQIGTIRSDMMGSLKTLRNISDFISKNSSGLPAPEQKVSHVPVQSTASSADASDAVISLISEKTGYPAEMLELNMSLDSDLGIDSIKRVEIFSALAEKFSQIAALKPNQMGGLKTISDIIGFVSSNSSTPAVNVTEVNVAAPSSQDEPNNINEALLNLVSEKTGYPSEMLELDMSLDSDLGIDSIKRVEIFSALSEKFSQIGTIKSDMMGSLKTLRNISDFISSTFKKKDVSQPDVEAEPAGLKKNSDAGVIDLPEIDEHSVLNLVRQIPKPFMLGESQDRNTFVIPENSDILIASGKSGFAKNIKKALITSGYNATMAEMSDVENIEIPDNLRGLLIVSPSNNVDGEFLLNSFKLLKRCSKKLREAGKNGGSFFVTVSRLDGRFGFENIDKKAEPLSGALAGLAKTAKREWPEVHCRAIDIEADYSSNYGAACEVAEEIFAADFTEAGISKNGKSSIELISEELSYDYKNFPLENNDLIIITGGARGVTAECAIRFSQGINGKKPALLLIGRSIAPQQEPEWLVGLSDEASIKKGIITHFQGKPTPKQVEDEYKKIIANREMLSTISRIEKNGVRVIYRSADIRDKEQLSSIISEAESQFGMVKGLVHGAGVIADKLIEDKSDEDFARVYNTKVNGFENILDILKERALKVLTLFSSSTGRYGRIGQVDYAVANEALNKIADKYAKANPGCRTISVNWGPWDGGMVTPALKKIFEAEGVGIIPLKEGAEYLIREICSSSEKPVEIVIQGKVKGSGNNGFRKDVGSELVLTTAFETELSIENFPFLKSHVIGGKGVLPMAIMVEWLSHGAMHANPGFNFAGFDDLRVLRGIKIEPHDKCTLRVLAGKVTKNGDVFIAPAEITSSVNESAFTVNAKADIILSSVKLKSEGRIKDLSLSPYGRSKEEMYSKVLFHGTDFQGIEKVEGCSDKGICAIVKSSPAPSDWIKHPLRNSWISDPLAIDCSFQMMILWSFEEYKNQSLPCYAGKYRQFGQFGTDDIVINIEVTEKTPNRAVADIEFTDKSGKLVGRMEKYECTIDPSLSGAFSNNRLAQMVEI